jgi:disulfide bond formation protein DsbB
VSTATFSTFFALLALTCWGATFLTWGLVIARRQWPDSYAAQLFGDLADVALWFAWIVALVTMLGSLYFSEIADFTPCKLCWFQRIEIYPFAFILLVAALRRDRNVGWYVIPQAIVGAGFAAYQTYLQAYPNTSDAFCSLTEPCSTRYVWEFGFVSLPFMSLAASAFIVTMVLVSRSGRDDAFEDDNSESDLPSVATMSEVQR